MAAAPILHETPRAVEYAGQGGGHFFIPLWSAPCCEAGSGPGGSCGVRVSSYVRVGRVPGVDCDQPLQLVFRCGAIRVTRCDSRREDKCTSCSSLHRRYLVRRAEDGCQKAGFIYLLTLTAPGDGEHLAVDPKQDGTWANHLHPKAHPSWRQKGQPRQPCRCALPEDGLEAWNPTAGACWNRLRTNLSRLPGVTDFQYLRVAEVQDGKRHGGGCPPGCEHAARGAIHHHVLIRVDAPLDPKVVQAYAIAAGYGCSMDLSVMPAARAARYVAKYAAKGYTKRADVPWRDQVLDKETGELRTRQTAAYRTVSQSQGWGLTLRQIRDGIKAGREKARQAVALVEELDSCGSPHVRTCASAETGSDPPA